jgi:hypothetical protein
MSHIDDLKNRLKEINGTANIPMRGGYIQVTPVLCDGNVIGVNVDGLGNYPFISIDVFVVTISLLYLSENHTARKGNAMEGHLGDDYLPLNSVEGHVAHVIYGNQVGQRVFRRITPISRILEWAGIVENTGDGFLRLII